jgi:hypothetical protein
MSRTGNWSKIAIKEEHNEWLKQRALVMTELLGRNKSAVMLLKDYLDDITSLPTNVSKKTEKNMLLRMLAHDHERWEIYRHTKKIETIGKYVLVGGTSFEPYTCSIDRLSHIDKRKIEKLIQLRELSIKYYRRADDYIIEFNKELDKAPIVRAI